MKSDDPADCDTCAKRAFVKFPSDGNAEENYEKEKKEVRLKIRLKIYQH